MIIIDTHEIKTNFIIYLLRNKINNKFYIGQTKTTIKERLRKHIKPSKNNKQIITRAIKKYGEQNFICEILFYAKSFEEMNIKEIEFIFEYNCIDNNGNDFTPKFIQEKIQRIKNYLAYHKFHNEGDSNEN